MTADHAGKFVKVWDAATGQELLTLPGLGWPELVAFTPDGRRLVAAGMGGTRVFDAAPAEGR